MMDRKALETLARVYGQHCISLFIPTSGAGKEQEDRICYKNALSEVKNQLVNQGVAPETIHELLEVAKSKIDDLGFWNDQSQGLAVFIYHRKTAFYRLPIDFSASVYVGNYLDLKPLNHLVEARV